MGPCMHAGGGASAIFLNHGKRTVYCNEDSLSQSSTFPSRGVHPPKLYDAYCIFPYLHKIYKFPPISAKLMHFPLFPQHLICLHNVCFFPSSPYFGLNTFMHHALHVGQLDVPASVYTLTLNSKLSLN